MAEALDSNALAIVFSFLDIFTVVKLALVNKAWSKAVKHEKVTSVLDVSGPSTTITRVDIGKALPHLLTRYGRCSGLRVLVLKGCYSLKEEHLEKILALGANTLENINLEACVALRTLKLLENKPFLHNIRTLNFSRCRNVNSFPSIQCPLLHTLHASQCSNIFTAPFLELLRGSPSLTYLNFAGSRATDEFLTAIGQLTSLRWLNLNDCSSITSKGVSSLKQLTALEHLDLSWCNAVDDSGISSVASSSLSLRELKIAQIYNITDVACMALTKLTNLQILDLEEDFRITESGLEQVFAMKSLRHLTLKGVSVDPNLHAQFIARNPQCIVKMN